MLGPKPTPNRAPLELTKLDSTSVLDVWEILTQLGFGDVSLSGEVLATFKKQLSGNDWRLIVANLGEARYLSFEGKLLAGYELLTNAKNMSTLIEFDLPPSFKDEIKALALYIKIVFDLKFGMKNTLLLDHFSGQSLTSSKNFKLAFQYGIDCRRLESNELSPQGMLQTLHELGKANLPTLVAAGYRVLGIHFRKKRLYDEALDMYKKGTQVAETNNFRNVRDQIRLAVGLCQFHQGRLDTARITLSALQKDQHIGYTTPFIYENLAVIADKEKNYQQAVDLVKIALTNSMELDHVEALPSECLYLGETYETHFQDLEKAEYYLKLGYDNSMRYAEAGIALVHDRKGVVEAYVDFIKRHNQAGGSQKTTAQLDQYSFAQGLTWKTIKETFQHQLLLFHLKVEKTGKRLAARLEMPATTLYSLQTRLKKKGYALDSSVVGEPNDPHALQAFVQKHSELSWSEINAVFEREIILYLYEKYGYNKLRMSKVLNLSYAIVIQKTRDITAFNENLLTN